MDTAAEKLMEKLSPNRVRVTFKLEDFKPPCSDFFSSFLFFWNQGDFATGRNISHLLAKLYSASFLSWRDKCLSTGDFPKVLAAGCRWREMEISIPEQFTGMLHENRLQGGAEPNLYGGCRSRGVRGALGRPKGGRPGRFRLTFLLVLQQVGDGGVNTIGFCCTQYRVQRDTGGYIFTLFAQTQLIDWQGSV